MLLYYVIIISICENLKKKFNYIPRPKNKLFTLHPAAMNETLGQSLNIILFFR